VTAAGTRALWGRQRERAALSQLLFDVRSGRSRVLVLRGEPGIGKTALLDDLCRRADDVVLVRGAGVESEAELAFAGLHQMCAQMIHDKLDLLPDPQREAIQVAFGESSGGLPNPFLLGLAVLNRLADAAAEQPVLCLVDDAQWLDRATAQTLAFVARRLDAEAVGIVFVVREPIEQFAGLPELVVPGLAPEDARDLLGTALTAPVDQTVRERFIAETHGNPLALLELSRGLTDERVAVELERSAGRAQARGGYAAEAAFLERALTLTADFGRRAARSAVATAVFGPPADAFTLIDASLRAATDRGEGRAVRFIQFQKAILCNALGRYEDAWTAVMSAYPDPSFYSVEILTELIESAARSGCPGRAAAALEYQREVASAAGTDWILGVEARCRALLDDAPTAEGAYRASIGHLQRTRRPVALARSHLVYGEWLRREGRRIDARQQLRVAREMFDAIGAVAFTDRAARELAATGETVRKRPGDGDLGSDLTVREAQIARLAADGLSNREIGEQLFISHRTVGYHLGKVFSKLDVANRAQLHHALDGATSY
jgi:DNA-binding CsgD family transcriptional regulator